MPNINKVVFGNQTLIDLSTTTLSSASQLESGVTAYARDGSVITGTGSGGGVTAATGEFTLASDIAAPANATATDVFPGIQLSFKPDFLWITMTEASFQALADVTNHIFGIIAIRKNAIHTYRFTTNSSTASLTKDYMFFTFNTLVTSTDSPNGYMQNGIGSVALNRIESEQWKINDNGTFNWGAIGNARLGWYAGTYRYIGCKWTS